MAAGLARSRGTKNAAICGDVAEWEASELHKGSGPGKPNSKAVEEGTHGSRIRTGRRRPHGRVDYVQACSSGKVLRDAWRGGDEA